MGGRFGKAGVLFVLVFAMSACNRDAVPLTECAGPAPAVDRVKDVGPPNCAEVLPESPPPSAVTG